MHDDLSIRDGLHVALQRGGRVDDRVGLVGFGVAEVFDEHGRSRLVVPFRNLITDTGDAYLAAKAVQGIAPASPAAPTAITGMKLGTGTTAAAKSGAGAALVTYLTASNVAFDTTYPQTSNLGAGLGVNAVFRCTWGAGVATSATINEVVIVTDSATNATSSAANTTSRAVFGSTINKGALDSLVVTWNYKLLGA